MYYSFTAFFFFFRDVLLECGFWQVLKVTGELGRHYCEANYNNSVNQCLLVIIQPEWRFDPGLVNTRSCY